MVGFPEEGGRGVCIIILRPCTVHISKNLPAFLFPHPPP